MTHTPDPPRIPASRTPARVSSQRLTFAHDGGFSSSALYRFLLLGRTPEGVRIQVPELWPGNSDDGRGNLSGIFRLGYESHRLNNAAEPPQNASQTWQAWFHAHGWLADLRALSGEDDGGKAPYFAREWVSTWLDANTKWSDVAWAPEVAAQRIVNWIHAWPFLVRNDTAGTFEKRLRRAIGRDSRHIFKSPPKRNQGFAYLRTLKAQVFAATILWENKKRLHAALKHLEEAITAQVLPDGGHIERNPERLSTVLADLLELKALFSITQEQIHAKYLDTGILQNAIDRAAPMLRALCHPDGGLAVFNGGLEGDLDKLDQILAQTDPTTTPPHRAPYSGFQHLNAGTTHIIMDCGKPAAAGQHHHAGVLSFEMSAGTQRLIVNCGARNERDDPWRTALAATAAHSTLSVNDTSSAASAQNGTLRRGPQAVTCKRRDSDDGVVVETSHDGYMNAFGLTHHRAIFIAPSGLDVRGEDRLVGTGGEYFAIRFHLHPDVKASLLGNGAGALLRFGFRHKETWRLRISNGEVALKESVYLGRAGEARRSEQIVISGPLTGNGTLVKWALNRE